MPEEQASSFYVAKPILHNLDRSKLQVEEGDQDRVFVIDGREGSGKSTLALQLAYKVDNTLPLDRVVFTPEDFRDACRTAEKYQAIVFDEAFNGLSSAGVLSKENKKLVRLLMEVRQRNLYIFIVLPSIFLLEKYVGVFRSQCLFHVYKIKGHIKRRKYKVYNYSKKKELYLRGKKEMSYKYPKINKNHRFYGKYPPTIDKKAYLKKKDEAFGQDEEQIEAILSRPMVQRNLAMYFWKQDGKVSNEHIAKTLTSAGETMTRQNVDVVINNVYAKLQNAN